MIITAYIIIIILVYFSITAIPQSIIAGFIIRLTNSEHMGLLFGGLVTWFLINIIWFNIFGRQLPILLSALSILALIINLNIGRDKLKSIAVLTIIAEIWAIILVNIITIIVNNNISWV